MREKYSNKPKIEKVAKERIKIVNEKVQHQKLDRSKINLIKQKAQMIKQEKKKDNKNTIQSVQKVPAASAAPQNPVSILKVRQPRAAPFKFLARNQHNQDLIGFVDDKKE